MTLPSPSQQAAHRRIDMASRYLAGETLQAIGDTYGITRERVRQVIKKVGLTGADSGRRLRAKLREDERAAQVKARRDARTMKRYGCDYDTANRINGGQFFNKNGTPVKAFWNQKWSATYTRKIEWRLTLPEWYAIWEASGHLHERGRGRDGYCMARFNDVGPYAVGNVYITSIAGNVRDYQAALKVRGVVCPDGWTRLPEKSHIATGRPRPSGIARNRKVRGWTLVKKSKTNRFQVVIGGKYIGRFPTQEAAEQAVRNARQAG